MNISDEEFWNSLENSDESSNNSEKNTHLSLEEQLKMLSVNEMKTIEKLKQLQARNKKITAQVTTAERKARNHRLYRMGEIVEKILDRHTTDEDVAKLEAFLLETEQQNKKFSNAMNK